MTEEIKRGRGRPRKSEVDKEDVATAPQLTEELKGLLSAEDVAELEALANDEVLEERKDVARKAFLRDAIKKAKHRHIPAEKLMSIQIDLPGHADRIMIDGTVFLHGGIYEVPQTQYDTLRDIVYRAWQHEHEVGGANANLYRKPRGTQLRPEDVGRTNSSLMRV